MVQLSAAATATALVAATTAQAASLADICTVELIQAALPADGTIANVTLNPSSVTASAVYNATVGGGGMMRKRQTGPPTGTDSASAESYNYCNVTATYAHGTDTVVVWYGFPEPSAFNSRFYVGGGGGYSLASGVTGGLEYGAVSGCTDAGYDAFSNSLDAVVLNGNGSVNWQNVKMFGYEALGEMTAIGKEITKSLYSIDKVYTYFSGCSDGGREAMSQVQRWGDLYDGVAAGAPAFRHSQQQVQHLFPAVVEITKGYYPPPCALDVIVNKTIEACDPLDGRTDGVVARTDLCKLNFDLTTIIGEPYSCAAQNNTGLGYGFDKRSRIPSKRWNRFAKRQQTSGSTTSYVPAQNGTVTADDVAVAQAVYDGLFNSAGQQAYLSWQIGSALSDADPTYDSDTAAYTYAIQSTGGVFVAKMIQEVDEDNLPTLDGVDYDQLVSWMAEGMDKYYDTLQTTYVDLSEFREAGGKLLHYHGESDSSIPSPSSVRYYDSVRTFMYPDQTYNESVSSLDSWYRFFQVPGAGHCGTNSLQANGPYPSDLVGTLIAWVEQGVEPTRLNATVSSGDYSGEVQMLCPWPLRPLWTAEGVNAEFDCVYDQASIDSWTYEFPAFDSVVY